MPERYMKDYLTTTSIYYDAGLIESNIDGS